MKTLPIFLIIFSIMFMNSSHPIVLMLIILTQAILLCLIIWMLMKMSWFSFILFLIFLGGLMVLFIYISSLASNEKFYLKFNMLIEQIMVMYLLSTAYLILNFNKTYLNMQWNPLILFFNEIYSKSMFLPTIITITYLLLTLIVVVKISSKYEGPMRNMIFK